MKPLLPVPHRIAPLLILSALSVLGGCSGETGNAPKAGAGAKSPGKVPVTVAAAARKSMPVTLEAVGNVEPYTTVAIRSKVEGELLRIAFREGDDVTKGQRLFEIDPSQFKSQVRQAEANLARDRAQLENARSQVQRYEQLRKKSFVSEEIMQRARTDVEVYAANVQADEAVLGSARLRLADSYIDAPINGRTGRIMVHQGNQVKTDGNSPLVVINQIEPIHVNFAIPEQRLAELKSYAQSHQVAVSAEVAGAQGPRPVGELRFIDNAVDTTTGTIKLKATFPNKDRGLWPGQFVKVFVELGEDQNALTVPAKAVQTGPRGAYVFVVKPDQTVEMRDVVQERQQGDEAVIGQGLEADEKVVLDGQSRLVNGVSVEIKPGP
ncbi:MAG: efflux RND transporter periplasmic adaptor subunit [Methylococcus sp.]|nr:efflux RND transporter periplasmic adaptor subunit [Methylococcus sp.]